MSNMPVILSQEIEEAIVHFIDENKLYEEVSPDKPIEKGIFELVENKCCVVYYPITDAGEKNDGMLISDIPMGNGEKKDIMYINTYQTEEKQVFAAAHELGHLLNVAEYVNNICDTSIEEERIVNRFAAVLLMPKKIFNSFIIEGVIKKKGNNGVIESKNLLEIIVEAMNYFSVPYNSVVIRLVETGLITERDGKILVDGSDSLPLDYLKKYVAKIIFSGNYDNLMKSSRKKSIAGLEGLLREAEQKQTESIVKIERLREVFGIVKNEDDFGGEVIRISEDA